MRNLTKPQRDLLALLVDGPRNGITDTRVARALARKGLAERRGDDWHIKPFGLATLRARLAEHREGE